MSSGAHFHTTRWSIVLGSTDDGSTGRAALEELCRTYWYPLYALARRRGVQASEAVPLGDSAYELARIEGESGRDELWAERRGVPFDAEGRIQRLSEDADEWCWQYVPW